MLALGFLSLVFLFVAGRMPSGPGLFTADQIRFLSIEDVLLLLGLGAALGTAGTLLSLGRYFAKW